SRAAISTAKGCFMPLLLPRGSGPTSLAVRKSDPALPAILEFQSPSAAVVAAPLPLMARGTIWAITGLITACLLVMGLVPIERVVSAPGKVISQTPPLVVQPLETAIVRSIDVAEGQRVRAGELLARLDSTFVSADIGSLSSQVSALQAEVARLQAEF